MLSIKIDRMKNVTDPSRSSFQRRIRLYQVSRGASDFLRFLVSGFYFLMAHLAILGFQVQFLEAHQPISGLQFLFYRTQQNILSFQFLDSHQPILGFQIQFLEAHQHIFGFQVQFLEVSYCRFLYLHHYKKRCGFT